DDESPADDGDGSEKVTINLGGDEPATDPGATAEQKLSVNLVEYFDDGELKKIAYRAIEDYDDDIQSRSAHMKALSRYYQLYASVMRPKSWPFQNAANVNVPLLTTAWLQLHGRIFDMLVPEKGNVYQSLPTRASDPEEVDRAERTELFVNWYIRWAVPEYRMSYDATFWQVLGYGDAFRTAYWDTSENRLRPVWIGVDDFVVPYSCKVTDPSMRGVPRYTWVKRMSLFEIQDRGEKGEYFGTEKLRPESASDDSKRGSSEMKDVIDEVDGKSAPTRRFMEDEERQVLEQHRWLRMPDDTLRPGGPRHPSFDGKPHPVIVTLDEPTEAVLRIVLREEDDPADARRFAREDPPYQAYLQQQQLHEAMGGRMPDPNTGEMVETPPPAVVPKPKPVRQREMCLFTHYQCFQSEGFYGLGLGSIVGSLNEAMNTLINQQIDRSTVNNAGGGLMSRQLRGPRGPMNRQPGAYIEVDAPPQALANGLINWPQVAPDPQGQFFISYIEQASNRATGTGDTLSGEPIGANETARGAMARVEQAQKQISVLASRFMGYMTCDLNVIWRLFSVYLDENEYHEVVDSHGKPRSVQIGRKDFIADPRVLPTADPRMSSRAQRIDEATQYLQQVTNPQGAPPELMNNPQIRHDAISGLLVAMDRHEVVDMLPPVPPQPPPPPPPVPQWEENANFLRDKDQQVNPADDDDEHLIEMQLFDQDPLGAPMLSPTAQKMYENHRRFHLAAKLEKERRAHEQQQQQSGGPGVLGPGGTGLGGMAPPSANGGPPSVAPAGPGAMSS
ncbi:MAG TPA: hypothetical protein VNG04_04370, partial [Candidatus Acidoferrum sp.]|nr:hypothetical protein [Candidatus Acidoferrum sp.]